MGANPTCATGRLPINFDQLLKGTDYDAGMGQSPAAFARGNRFEKGCAGPTLDFAPLRAALLDVGIDIGAGGVDVMPESLADERRADRTRRRIAQILSGDLTHALLYQAALEFHSSGQVSFIRPDAVVLVPADGRIVVVEMKGFRLRAGCYPADKIASALGQSAIYQIALRRIARSLAFDPALISNQVVIVCAKNRGLVPVATVHDNADRVATYELRLARQEQAIVGPGVNVEQLLVGITPESSEAERLAAFVIITQQVGTSYCPNCIEACGAALYCREQAADNPARLGATRLVSAAGSITVADGWSHGERTGDPVLDETAVRLSATRRLLDLARNGAGLSVVPPPRRAAGVRGNGRRSGQVA